MNINKLPTEIQNKIFYYLSHPCAEKIKKRRGFFFLKSFSTVNKQYLKYDAEKLNCDSPQDTEAIAFDMYVNHAVESRYQFCDFCYTKMFRGYDEYETLLTFTSRDGFEEGYKRVCEKCS
jgi:hypothetical protein